MYPACKVFNRNLDDMQFFRQTMAQEAIKVTNDYVSSFPDAFKGWYAFEIWTLRSIPQDIHEYVVFESVSQFNSNASDLGSTRFDSRLGYLVSYAWCVFLEFCRLFQISSIIDHLNRARPVSLPSLLSYNSLCVIILLSSLPTLQKF